MADSHHGTPVFRTPRPLTRHASDCALYGIMGYCTCGFDPDEDDSGRAVLDESHARTAERINEGIS